MSDRSKLLQMVPDRFYYKTINQLKYLREAYPGYPDHELLIYLIWDRYVPEIK